MKWRNSQCIRIILRRRGCKNSPKHMIVGKKANRSSKMKSEHDSLKKQFRLICVFPEKTPDEETVKSDVKKILSAELKEQMQR